MRLLTATTAVLALAAVGVAGTATSATKVLKGSVGPAFVITVKTSAGKPVKTLKAGTYKLIVQDKSAIHDFHLIGPGVNKVITTVPFQGTKSVVVKLKKGRYIYECDPHVSFGMKGSFKVTG
jgi:plastocyanin